jgi:hypothetical protein
VTGRGNYWKVVHLEGKGGERAMAIPRFQGGRPHVCRLRIASFWPRWQALIYTDHLSGFMGCGRPSSLVTTLSNRTSLLWGGLLEGEWGSPGWRPGQASLGIKTSSLEQGPNFDLVGISWMVVIRETSGVTRTTCWSSSSPAGCTPIWIVVTLSDMSDRLSVAIIS